VIEHKGLFNTKGPVARDAPPAGAIGRAELLREGTDATVIATLLMAARSLEAAEALSAEGIELEVMDLTWLRPMDVDAVARSLERTGRLVVVEEGHHAGGWGATLVSELTLRGHGWAVPPRFIGLADEMLIPYSPDLEDQVIPSAQRIAEACRDLVRRG
jgi:pyruvate dehydrogenase E1 component beta subunit